MKKVDFKKILRYFTKGKLWGAIVIVFIVFLVALVLSNIYFFWTLEKKMSQPLGVEVEVQQFRRDLLTQILERLNSKEKQFNQNTLTKPDVSDPSL